jgi:hypothetical protein
LIFLSAAVQVAEESGKSVRAVIVAARLLFYRMRVLSDAAMRNLLVSNETMGELEESLGEDVTEEEQPWLDSLGDGERRLFWFVGEYQTKTIIGLAIAESVGVFGFVLVVQGATPETIYPFVAASICLCLCVRPNMEALLQKATGWLPS